MESPNNTSNQKPFDSRDPSSQAVDARLQALEKKLDRLTSLVEPNLKWQSKFSDFVEEMTPVARAVTDSSISEFDRLDKLGLFLLGSDVWQALERAAAGYQVGSLPELADSLADVSAVASLLTQPKVLAAASDVGQEFLKSTPEPVELLGAAKRIESERDLQRGLGFVLDLLGTLGRSVSRAPRIGGTLTQRPLRRAAVPRPQHVIAMAPGTGIDEKTTQGAVTGTLPFVGDLEWNRSWAQRTANQLGFGELTETMWKVIEFSRADYKASKKSPNIRRITTSLGISTKEIYALFPSAPGPTISQIAGVPKPAGCL